ncbi:MAG: hypothetical protein ACM3WP_02005 [Acidobacteriota bacterium]
MSGPSQYVRQKREEAARRRLELAKMLRDDPKATNKQLAKALGVNRDTIALDRKAIMEEMTKSTLTETELMRAEMVTKLEALEAEVQLHRKDGKLPITAIDQLLSITKALVELTGCRKPVNEKVTVQHRAPIRFNTVIVGADGVKKPVIEMKEPFALSDGNESR